MTAKQEPRAGTALKKKRNIETKLHKLAGELAPFEESCQRRLFLALGLLNAAAVAKRIDDAEERQEEAQRLIPAFDLLGRMHPQLDALKDALMELGSLIGQLEDDQENEKLIGELRTKMRGLRRQLKDLAQGLDHHPYPLDHAQGEITLRAFALPSVPADADDLGALFEAASEALEKLYGLYARLGGRLAITAEKVESVLGLKPLPLPASPPEDESSED